MTTITASSRDPKANSQQIFKRFRRLQQVAGRQRRPNQSIIATNRKNKNNISLTKTHDEGEEITVKHFLPLFGKIFGVEMPHLNKFSMLKWFLVMGLWTTTIVSCLIATILMASPLLTDYLQYPTTSSLTVMYNSTFQLPKTTFCLPLPPFYFNDEWNSSLNEAAIVKYFSQKNVTKSQFLNPAEPWPNALLAVSLTYNVLLTYSESYERTDTIGLPSTFSFLNNQNFLFFSTFYGVDWEITLRFEKQLIALNITTNELQQTLGRTLGALMKLSVSLQEATTSATYGEGGTTLQNISINQLKTSYLGFLWVCYILDFTSLNITIQSTFAGQFIQIQMDGSNLNIDPWADTTPYDAVPMILVDLKNRRKVPMLVQTIDTADNMMQGVFGTIRKYAISASAVYRAMHIKNNTIQCAELNTLDLCRWECRSELIHKVCGCNAVTLPKNASQNGSDCSLAKYRKCDLTFVMSDEEACVNSCQQPCEQWKFDCRLIESFGIPWSYDYMLPVSYNPQKSYTATVQLAVTDFEYPVFQEHYVWTLQDFIGAFGGVMGVFLGLDVTILLQMLFYTLAVFRGICGAIVQNRKKKMKTTTPLNANVRTVVIVPK